MSDVGGVGGSQPEYSPEEIRGYKKDYEKGFDLFQRAFHAYNQPKVEEHKKEQLKKVMHEALNIMNETASIALKKDKLVDEERLSNDYAAFVQNPTEENQKKVQGDLESLK